MFKVPTELTITQAEECKVLLIEHINEHEEITFDDSDVNRIDTIGIQLLLSAITYIASQNKKLIWQVKSPIIKQSIKQLGINEPILNQYIND